MGFLDDLLGNTSAQASHAAAADTYAKQQAAVTGIQGAGQNYATGMAGLGSQYGALGNSYQPWINTGQTANNSVQQLLSNPNSVSSLPGYQFQMDQGTKALDHSAAAAGNLFSGAQGKALVGYGQNLANTNYSQDLSNLMGISNQGLGAQGQQNAAIGQGIQTTGQGLTGQVGASTSAYNGQMTDAGTIGQGNVAAANAQMQGAQGLLNLGGSIIGTGLGGYLGGVGKAGGSLASLFGSSAYGGGGGVGK